MSDFHTSLVRQAANEMETYKKKMLTYPKIGSTISNKSKIKLFAVILNYRQDVSPSFRTQNAA